MPENEPQGTAPVEDDWVRQGRRIAAAFTARLDADTPGGWLILDDNNGTPPVAVPEPYNDPAGVPGFLIDENGDLVPDPDVEENEEEVMPMPRRDGGMEAVREQTMGRLLRGEQFAYNSNIIRYLNVTADKIPKRSFGIELEFHTSQAWLEFSEAYAKYVEAKSNWISGGAFRSVKCKELAKHYTPTALVREREKDPKLKYDICPFCSSHYIIMGADEYKALMKSYNDILATGPKEPKEPKGERGARQRFIASLARSMNGEFIAKRDGSLNEDHGTEIVSVPLRLAEALVWLEKVGRACEANGACVPTSSYGMHVHVDRRAFMGRAHIMRFYHALNAKAQDQQLIRYIGEARHHANLNGDLTRTGDPWAKVYRGGFRRLLDLGVSRGDHHDAVSLKPIHTVEVRIFQSSTDFNITCANLEFVAALLEYTTPGADIGSIVKFKFENFYAWVLQRKYKDYSFLYERLLTLIGQGELKDPRTTEEAQRIEAQRKRKAKHQQQCAS